MQPAYCKQNDTVYWCDNIGLSDSLIIPDSATVIIKPGTHIFAANEAQLVVYGNLVARGKENYPVVISANIMTDTDDYWQGITFANGSTSSLEYVEISNAEFGILYQDYTSQILRYSTFENNEVGVGAFSSSPKIFRCTFTGNATAVGSYSNGSPVLTDLARIVQYRNALVNNVTGVYVAGSSVYLDGGYNDIYNVPASGYYVYSTGSLRIAASLNYWGSVSGKDIQARMYPVNFIITDPICTSANTGFKNSNPAKELLGDAYHNLDEGQINDALSGFNTIVTNYPLSGEAYLAVPGIFACYQFAGNNWNNLETYLSGLYNDSTSLLDKDLLFGYLNLCLRQQEKYSEAIANYESVILNNPTYNDSVFAVINIGNTYRESGSFKASLGTLGYLRPQSDAAHIEKTIDLLKTLRPDKTDEPPLTTKNNCRLEIFPNPASGSFTVKIYTDKDDDVAVKIINGSGNIVKEFTSISINSGENLIQINDLAMETGIYLVSVEAGGKKTASEKVLIYDE